MSFRGTEILKHVKGTLKSVEYLYILTNCAIPSAHLLDYGNDFFFQDDGAPCYRAKIVKDWHTANGVRCLENWPPQSPDLNPIENLWHDMKISLRRKQHRNMQEFATNVRECWKEVTVERCQTPVRSMPN